jgi:hypothetical protein
VGAPVLVLPLQAVYEVADREVRHAAEKPIEGAEGSRRPPIVIGRGEALYRGTVPSARSPYTVSRRRGFRGRLQFPREYRGGIGTPALTSQLEGGAARKGGDHRDTQFAEHSGIWLVPIFVCRFILSPFSPE